MNSKQNEVTNRAPDEMHAGHSVPRGKWVFIGFVAISVFFLFTEHRAHYLGVLPWLLLAACPLMHFFLHGGNGNHDVHGGTEDDRSQGERK